MHRHIPRNRFGSFTFTAAALAALAAGACDGPEPDAAGEALSVTASAITQERTGGVAEIVSRRYGDPEIARVSYASALLAGVDGALTCSAAMIGPNVAMSAAHCGPRNDAPLIFRTYRNRSTATADTETFRCNWLAQTFKDTDLALHFCAPNAAGENPGDKYGYLDFDTSAPSVGQRLYSVWWNPLDSQTSDARLYSEGKVTSTSYAGWFTPGGDPGLAIGIESDVYGAPGSSGSPQLNPSNHRILVGPTSLAPRPEGAQRHALSIRDYPLRASVSSASNVNATEVRAHGLSPDRYVGAVDRDRNFLFDLQEDLEAARGENARSFYWLGFESERRNALWTPGPSATIDARRARARITKTTSDILVTTLAHHRLPIQANVAYRFSVSTWTASAANNAGLYVALIKDGRFHALGNITGSPGAGWQRHAVVLTSSTPGTHLAIVANEAIDVYLQEPVLVRNDRLVDFDEHDQRLGWRNGNTGARAQILPDGTAPGMPDWAGVVTRDTRFARGSDFGLATRRLAFAPNRSYQVCLRTRQASAAAPTTNWALLRVVDGTSEILRTAFRPQADWGGFCTGTFRPRTADVDLQLGVDADPIPVGFERTVLPSFLVDDLDIREVT